MALEQQMNQQQSTMTLLRHGEPLGGPIFRGITDDALTESGWQQMTHAVKKMPGFELILTSPLRRCSKFAKELSDERALPLQQLETLKEINFGQWEGKSARQIESESASLLKKFWQNPIENTPPDGEPLLEFQQRVLACWNDIIIANKGKNCLIISHGGVQKIILAQVLNMPVEAIHTIEVPYACCSVIQVYYSGTGFLSTLKSHGERS